MVDVFSTELTDNMIIMFISSALNLTLLVMKERALFFFAQDEYRQTLLSQSQNKEYLNQWSKLLVFFFDRDITDCLYGAEEF